MGTRRGECLVFPINEHFEVSRLPQSLAARWARFSPQQNDIQRANALRRATRGIYSPSKVGNALLKLLRGCAAAVAANEPGSCVAQATAAGPTGGGAIAGRGVAAACIALPG